MQVGKTQHFFRMSEDEEKVKLRRLEPAIQKFTKIVIPTDLERLRKHQINIEKVSFFIFFLFFQFFLSLLKKQLHILIYICCAFHLRWKYQIRDFAKTSNSCWFNSIVHFFCSTNIPLIPFLMRRYKNRIYAFLVVHSDELSS